MAATEPVAEVLVTLVSSRRCPMRSPTNLATTDEVSVAEPPKT
jgi:hypothetical protein